MIISMYLYGIYEYTDFGKASNNSDSMTLMKLLQESLPNLTLLNVLNQFVVVKWEGGEYVYIRTKVT